MSDESKATVTLHGTLQKVIKSPFPNEPEKTQIGLRVLTICTAKSELKTFFRTRMARTWHSNLVPRWKSKSRLRQKQWSRRTTRNDALRDHHILWRRTSLVRISSNPGGNWETILNHQ